MSAHPQNPVSRRHFLRTLLAAGGTATASALLAACGGSTTESPPAATTASSNAGTSATANAVTGATAAPTTSAATAAPAANQATAPAVASQGVELTHWDWWVTQSPWLDNEIKLFQEANPGITIKRTVQSAKFDDLLQLAFKDGSAPDTFFSGLPFLDLVKNNYIKPISDYPDFDAFKKTIPNPEVSFTEGTNMLNGKTYTSPTEARSSWWNQIYVNTAVLEKYGVKDVPKTLDEYLDAMRTVTKNAKGDAYGWANPLSSGWTPQMVWYTGQLSGAPDGGDNFKTGRYDYSNPSYQKVLESFATMKNEGLILPESSSLDDEAIRALFAEGKAAFFTGGVWCIPGWAQTHPDFKNYTMMPPPLIGANQPTTFFYTSPGQAGHATYINPNTKHPDEAWTWYKWFSSRDAAKRWVTSGNGLSYWEEDNDPKVTDNMALKVYFENNAKLNKLAPMRTIRNPDIAKVSEPAVKPGENDLITGIYSGQVADIPGALAQLEKNKNAARDQGIADAVAAGAKIKPTDYAFPDWDPTKDYITKPA